MEHHFDVEIAEKYGIVEAILLNHFQFWIAKNEANRQNEHDGVYWTYNSVKAYKNLFPYLTERKIQNALKHLREVGILQTGNFNETAYDRTLWYAFTAKGKSIMQKCKMDCDEMKNGLCENVEPIPDNNTNNNTNNNTDINSEFETLWQLYPRKIGKPKALKAYQKARKNGTTFEKVKAGIEAYKRQIEALKTSSEYIKHGSTWFYGECWNDEYQLSIAERLTDLDDIF